MKAILLAILSIGSTSSFASQTFDGNYTVFYDCGFLSGHGLMGPAPEYEGLDKIFAPKVSVTVGNAILDNPSYTIKMSHRNANSQTCTIAGAGEESEFHWYISKNECTEIITQPLTKVSFNGCGVEVNIKK